MSRLLPDQTASGCRRLRSRRINSDWLSRAKVLATVLAGQEKKVDIQAAQRIDAPVRSSTSGRPASRRIGLPLPYPLRVRWTFEAAESSWRAFGPQALEELAPSISLDEENEIIFVGHERGVPICLKLIFELATSQGVDQR